MVVEWKCVAFASSSHCSISFLLFQILLECLVIHDVTHSAKSNDPESNECWNILIVEASGGSSDGDDGNGHSGNGQSCGVHLLSRACSVILNSLPSLQIHFRFNSKHIVILEARIGAPCSSSNGGIGPLGSLLLWNIAQVCVLGVNLNIFAIDASLEHLHRSTGVLGRDGSKHRVAWIPIHNLTSPEVEFRTSGWALNALILRQARVHESSTECALCRGT
mmetsp:Transcript_26113/g.31700  ORF Transcript_26113/g.31700 Transcript_26113/m.31700 type:complete len:220 (+) Transcript_26113:374-1033(+)